ncbi:alcohol dehydrogenase catalytic domain-containing protein [Streptomyces sp. NPDC048254]|uniref:alcohol dehydrogenase catalytic domain-containing protein n=1 Tax=Streptomyces sp. NPDC048254 TaxID=3365525 RepID=UPI003718FD8C
MRAAVLYGAQDVRVEHEIDEPSPGDGEVLLRPLYNGICGSDLHFWQEGPRHGVKPPIILGHEFSAEVVGAGPGVDQSRLPPGVLVAVEPMWTCGTCPSCRRGAYNVCRRAVWHGLSGKGGGMSGLTVVRAGMVHRLPETVDALQGALVEPVSVAHHGVTRSRVRPGEVALVLGAGPIGVAAVLDLRARGVERIVVSEPAARRRAAVTAAVTAVGGGDVHVLDPQEVDLVDAVRAVTAGEGAGVVIDAAGVEPAFHTGLAAAAPGGRMVVIASYTKPVTYDPVETFFGEIDIIASCGYRGDFPEVIELMAKGAYPMDGWVRHIGLDCVPDGFHRLHAGLEMKLLVDVQGT